MMKSMTFIAACKEYFGLRPGTTSTDFMKEVKALEPADREYFKKEFLKVGYDISN